MPANMIRPFLCTLCCLFLNGCLYTCNGVPDLPEDIDACNRRSEEKFRKSRERIEKKIEKGEINFPLPSDAELDSKQ